MSSPEGMLAASSGQHMHLCLSPQYTVIVVWLMPVKWFVCMYYVVYIHLYVYSCYSQLVPVEYLLMALYEFTA